MYTWPTIQTENLSEKTETLNWLTSKSADWAVDTITCQQSQQSQQEAKAKSRSEIERKLNLIAD
jgi:hypothetical protein